MACLINPRSTKIETIQNYPRQHLAIWKSPTSKTQGGYFCNDCVYYIKEGNECAIVKNDGPDVNGEESGTIAPHGECTLWVPIEEQDNNTKLNW